MACQFSVWVPFLEELSKVDRRKTSLGSSAGWGGVTTWVVTALWGPGGLPEARLAPAPRWGVSVGLVVLVVGTGHISGCGSCLVQHVLYSMLLSPHLKLGMCPPCPPWTSRNYQCP